MLGPRLLNLRSERGLTQAEAADALGTSQGAISKYETGARTPGPVVLAAMLDLYGASGAERLAAYEAAAGRDHADPQEAA